MREKLFHLETTDGEVFKLGEQVPKLKHQLKADEMLVRHMDYVELDSDEDGEPFGQFRVFCVYPETHPMTQRGYGMVAKIAPNQIARELSAVRLVDMGLVVSEHEKRLKNDDLAEGDPIDEDEGEPDPGPQPQPKPEVQGAQPQGPAAGPQV